MMARTEQLRPYNVTPERVSRALALNGWFCHHKRQGNGIPLTTSIGLTEKGMPFDIVMLGVDERLSRMMISAIFRNHPIGAGLTSGVRIDGVLEDYLIQLEALDDAAIERLNLEISAETGCEISSAVLVQVPDRNGLLPGDEGCDADFVACQSPSKIGVMM